MSLSNIFKDAHRRVSIAKQRVQHDRSRMWTGLDYPSGMKEAIKKGFMTPVFSETPRILGWYTFTEAGWAEYDRLYGEAPDYFSPDFFNYSTPFGRIAA